MTILPSNRQLCRLAPPAAQSRERRCSFILLGLLFLILVLGGCSRQKQSDPGPTSESPVPGGTVVIAFPAEPDVLNSLIRSSAYSGRVLSAMQDALVEMGEDFNYEPKIARAWTLAPDQLSLTYRLRPWRWSDGQPLSAYDVAATFALYKNPLIASPRRGSYRNVIRAVALDSFTIRYDFSRPLTDPVGRSAHLILPLHWTRDLDPAEVRDWPLNQAPLASGPFRFERWEHNQQLVLARNENYPGSPALLDRVIFSIVPDETSRLLQLEAGEVDFVEELPPAAAARLDAEGRVTVERVGGRLFAYMSWNFDNPRFSDPRVRKAMSLAIDRSRFVEGLLYGYGQAAASPLPPILWNHAEHLLPDPYQPEEARRLLAAAGWRDTDGDGVLDRDGLRFSFQLITRKGDPLRENGAVVIREYLRKVGIDVRPRVMEHGAGINLVKSGRFDAYLGHFQASLYADPSSMIRSDARDRFNYGGYSNAVVDSLLTAALSQADRALAKPIWIEIQERLAADLPAIYLYYPETLIGVSHRLRDVRPHNLSPYNNLHEWWIPLAERKYRSAAAD